MATGINIVAGSKLFKGLDVLKFIMALLVMEIHLGATRALPDAVELWCIKPLLAVPVPVFFLISSYFFFKKVHQEPESWTVLRHFLKRIVLLYSFWVVAWLPYLIAKKPYFSNGIDGVYHFFIDYFFGAVFGNSWFFGALIVGTTIIYLFSRYVSDKVWWILPTALFAYFRFVPILSQEATMPVMWYSDHIINPYISFPYNLFWIMLGYYISKPRAIELIQKVTTPYRWIFIIIGIASINLGHICSIVTLPFAVIAIFVAFFNWSPDISAEKSKWIRNSSILIYVMHGNLEKVFRIYFHFDHGPLLYLSVLVICISLSAIIIYLSHQRHFKWLRNAY